jgi:hypothetical protein
MKMREVVGAFGSFSKLSEALEELCSEGIAPDRVCVATAWSSGTKSPSFSTVNIDSVKLSAPRVRSTSLSLIEVLADASLTHMPTLDGPACQLRNDSAINNSRRPDQAGRPIFGMRVNILLASRRPFDERQRQPLCRAVGQRLPMKGLLWARLVFCLRSEGLLGRRGGGRIRWRARFQRIYRFFRQHNRFVACSGVGD